MLAGKATADAQPSLERISRPPLLGKVRYIGCSNYFPPIHLQPFYMKDHGFKRGDFPITERVADPHRHVASTPLLDDAERDALKRSADAVREVVAVLST